MQSKPSSNQEPSLQSLLVLPIEIDLALHVLPVASLLLDFFAFEHAFTDRECHRSATIVVSLFGIWYFLWLEYCASHNGTCEFLRTCTVFSTGAQFCLTLAVPYPFLNGPLYGRVIIYVATTALALFSFRGINKIHRRIFRSQESKLKSL